MQPSELSGWSSPQGLATKVPQRSETEGTAALWQSPSEKGGSSGLWPNSAHRLVRGSGDSCTGLEATREPPAWMEHMRRTVAKAAWRGKKPVLTEARLSRSICCSLCGRTNAVGGRPLGDKPSPVALPEPARSPLQGHGLALSPSPAKSRRSCRAWCSLWLADGDMQPAGWALRGAGGVRTPSSGWSGSTGGSVDAWVRLLGGGWGTTGGARLAL